MESRYSKRRFLLAIALLIYPEIYSAEKIVTRRKVILKNPTENERTDMMSDSFLTSCGQHSEMGLFGCIAKRIFGDNMRHKDGKALFGTERTGELVSQLHTTWLNYGRTKNPRSTRQVNGTCTNHIRRSIQDLFDGKLYAKEMLDAAGKPPSGLMLGQLIWMGAYDECKKVRAVSNGTKLFSGQYCGFQILTPALANLTSGYGIVECLCVPDSCTTFDIATLIKSGLRLLQLGEVEIKTALCSGKPSYSAGSYVALSLCGLLVLLAAVATVYDMCTYQGFSLLTTNQTNYGSLQAETGRQMFDSTSNSDISEEPDTINSHIAKHDTRRGIFGRLLLIFSIRTNFNQIFTVEKRQGPLQCLHGIRVLSMWWIILGHTYMFTFPVFVQNLAILPHLFKTWLFQIIPSAVYAVDSFLLLTGLLVTYLTLPQLPDIQGGLNWLKFWLKVYMHRYWRLTPVLMFAVLIWTTLFNQFTDGPFWDGLYQLGFTGQCQKLWWTNLLYVNNFFPNKQTGTRSCMPWSWYLAIDMQLYIISPLLIFLLYRRRYVGIGLVGLLLLFCLATRGGIARYFNVLPENMGYIYKQTLKASEMETFLYMRPFTRAAPFLVGVALGYVLHITKCTYRMHKVLVVVFWCISLSMMGAVVFGLYGEYRSGTLYSADVNALYSALARFVWALALAWVIFACITGYGGILNSLLCWKLWVPLSRLTYSAYLFHPMIIWIHYLSTRQLFYITGQSMMYMYLGHIVVSYATACLVVLMLESPCAALDRIIIKRQR